MDKQTHNQQIQELETFRATSLYRRFCEEHDALFETAMQTIIEQPPNSIQSFLQREQNIGALRELGARADWFEDLHQNELNTQIQ